MEINSLGLLISRSSKFSYTTDNDELIAVHKKYAAASRMKKEGIRSSWSNAKSHTTVSKHPILAEIK